jgi:N-formylglutamate deformylase
MVVRLDPADDPAPVVVDSPHSGQFYPDDFGAAVPLSLLRGGEDRFVDELFADSTRHGAVLIAARFARTYLDPNRSLEEIEPAMLSAPWPGPVVENDRTRMGVGLVFSKIGPGVDIYDRKLDVAEVERRIEICWRPYHEALRGALDSVRQRDGVVFHLNVHSMTAVGNELSPDQGQVRPDFSLGDLDGRSCAPEFTALVAETLKALGYTVAINEPYKGAELVARYSSPASGRHSLQIEVNRGLYMDGDTLERHGGFEALRADLGRLVEHVCAGVRTSTSGTARS